MPCTYKGFHQLWTESWMLQFKKNPCLLVLSAKLLCHNSTTDWQIFACRFLCSTNWAKPKFGNLCSLFSCHPPKRPNSLLNLTEKAFLQSGWRRQGAFNSQLFIPKPILTTAFQSTCLFRLPNCFLHCWKPFLHECMPGKSYPGS